MMCVKKPLNNWSQGYFELKWYCSVSLNFAPLGNLTLDNSAWTNFKQKFQNIGDKFIKFKLFESFFAQFVKLEY